MSKKKEEEAALSAEILIARFNGASDPADRREAIQGLALLLSSDPASATLEVVSLLGDFLRSGLAFSDGLIASAVLDGINAMCSSHLGEGSNNVLEGLISSEGAVEGIINLMSSEDVATSLGAVRVLISLYKAAHEKLEAALLSCPAGLQRVTDALRDAREAVRNETIRLFTYLTLHSGEVKKLMAFQGCLERLFAIMRAEGMLNGGGVVRDCLLVCINVLQGTPLAQKIFCEGPCLDVLHQLFDIRWLEGSSCMAMHEEIMLLSLSLLRVVLEDDGKGRGASSMPFRQRRVACGAQGLLPELIFHIALSRAEPYRSAPESIRSAGCCVIGDLFQDNKELQHHFGEALLQDIGEESVSLPARLVQETLDGSVEADAALRKFFHRNELGCTQSIAHIIAPPPPPPEVDIALEDWNPPPSAGKVLVSQIVLSVEKICPRKVHQHGDECWTVSRGSAALSMLMREGGPNAAEIALKVQIDENVTLLSWLTKAIEKNIDVCSIVCQSLLQVLCWWMKICAAVVPVLFSSPENLFLIDLAAESDTVSGRRACGGLACLALGIALDVTCDEGVRSLVISMVDAKMGIRSLSSQLDSTVRLFEAAAASERRRRSSRLLVHGHLDEVGSGVMVSPEDSQLLPLMQVVASSTRKSVIALYVHGSGGGSSSSAPLSSKRIEEQDAEISRLTEAAGEAESRAQQLEGEVLGLGVTIAALQRELREKDIEIAATRGEGHSGNIYADALAAEETNGLRAEVARLQSILEHQAAELLREPAHAPHVTPAPDLQVSKRMCCDAALVVQGLEEHVQELSAELVAQQDAHENELNALRQDLAQILQAREDERSNEAMVRSTLAASEARERALEKTLAELNEKIESPENAADTNDREKYEEDLLALIAQLEVVKEVFGCTIEEKLGHKLLKEAKTKALNVAVKRFGYFVQYEDD
jgi:hypothetical protein